MAAKLDAFFGQLAQIGQAHHLITAAIGKDRAIPAHEIVQPAKPRNPFRTRAQHQVVGVAKDDVGAGRAHAFRFHRLHRCGRADGHEGGRAYLAALHPDRAGARAAIGRLESEFKSGGHRAPCASADTKGRAI